MEDVVDEDDKRSAMKDTLSGAVDYLLEEIGKETQELDEAPPKRVEQRRRPRKRQLSKNIPETTGARWDDWKIPILEKASVPARREAKLRLELSAQEEVAMAILDAKVNEPEEAHTLQELRDVWIQSVSDILTGAPDQLPPLREVNHEMPWKDEKMEYRYHLPKCADTLKVPLFEKTEKYLKAGWWEQTNVPSAVPMLCISKKQAGKIRMVVDCRKRNENTVKAVAPFPDQEQIRNDVARALHRSKIDMLNAYEQIRINPKDVWKTVFATVYGTFVSHMMQQGDCNAPATFQRLMTTIFCDYIGRFLHVYVDNIFVFSDSIEEHEEHLRKVFDKLRKAQLYLEPAKLDLYSKRMDCLGHIIDDKGIHTV